MVEEDCSTWVDGNSGSEGEDERNKELQTMGWEVGDGEGILSEEDDGDDGDISRDDDGISIAYEIEGLSSNDDDDDDDDDDERIKSSSLWSSEREDW